MEKLVRLQILHSLDSPIARANLTDTKDVVLELPQKWTEKHKSPKPFKFYASRITTPDPNELGLNLSLVTKAGQGYNIHAAFNLYNGDIIQITLEDAVTRKRIQVSVLDDGDLEKSGKWKCKVAVARLDEALAQLNNNPERKVFGVC